MGRKTKTRTKKKGGDARMEDEKMSAKVDAMDEERMRVGGVGGDIDDMELENAADSGTKIGIVEKEDGEGNMVIDIDINVDVNDDDDTVDDHDGDGEMDVGRDAGSDAPPPLPIPFMDAFYSLSSDDPSLRTVAAHCLIRHCFPTSPPLSLQTKDASYTLRRLLAGLSSGRAAARQGYASGLASFLRAAFTLRVGDGDGDGKRRLAIDAIQKEVVCVNGQNNGDEVSNEPRHPASFIRDQLRSQTTPAQPSKRGSEERDYVFGRLFGIMAVVRSGSLTIAGVPIEVVKGYAGDLAQLYQHKKWMREPAVHGVMELLSALDATRADETFSAVVTDTIIPALFPTIRSFSAKEAGIHLSALTSEQIGLALHIQTLSARSDVRWAERKGNASSTRLPPPLDQPLFTVDSIPLMARALRDTSVVVYPRCHLVWNAVWSYLTVEEASSAGGNRKKTSDISPRVLRDSLPVGGEDGEKVVEALVNEIVVKKLVGTPGNGGTTHERRTLALILVQALCGASRPRICLPPGLVETTVLQPVLVERIFVNTIQTKTSGNQSRAEHTLKPLALQVLDSVINNIITESVEHRLAVVKALTRADPRFDSVTKTDAIIKLLHNAEGAGDVNGEYMTFLEEAIFAFKSHDAAGHVSSMLAFGKRALRSPVLKGEDENTATLILESAKRLLAFFLTGACFDFSSFGDEKKKKRQKRAPKSHPTVNCAQRIIVALPRLGIDAKVCLPYATRTALLTSFFSYLADVIAVAPALQYGAVSKSRIDKAQIASNLLCFVTEGCNELEQKGATLFLSDIEDLHSDVEDIEARRISPKEAQKEMRTLVDKASARGGYIAHIISSCSSLLTALYLQLLHCGSPDTAPEDEVVVDDDDDEEAKEETKELISDLLDITKLLLGESEKESPDDSEDAEKPLAALAELCVNILSSSVGGDIGKNAYRGGASKLLLDSVKNVWSLTLDYAKDSSGEIMVDQEVMAILLEAVCGVDALIDQDEMDTDMTSSIDNDDGNIASDGVFQAANAVELDMDEESNEDENDDKDDTSDKRSQDRSDGEEEQDVELDPDQLNNLLLEDSDDEIDEGELQHHAGADTALAKLIKMKQDARKAGQAARERINISNRLRCIALVELAISSDSLQNDGVVLFMILPLLRARHSLERAILSATSSSGPKKNLGLSERRALMSRISGLLQKKVCKARMNSIQFKTVEEREAHAELSNKIMCEARKSLSSSHCECCSLCLIQTVKYLPQENEAAVIVAKSVYCDAMKHWATIKSSKLSVCIFKDLVVRKPSLARVVLANSVADAAGNARSSYLKGESFRLLADIYNTARSDDSPLAGQGLDALKGAAAEAVSSTFAALQDNDLAKAKRARDVLKAASEIAKFCSSHCENDSKLWNDLRSLSKRLKEMKITTNSQAIKILAGATSKIIDLKTPVLEPIPISSDAGLSQKKKQKGARK